MKKRLFFSFVIMLLFAIMPVIYAETIENPANFIQQQISANGGSGQVTQEYAGKSLEYLLQNNPQFRTVFNMVMMFLIIVVLLSIVDIVLRGFAMWRASKNNSKKWFWILLVVNSLCILPLIYLFITRKSKKEKKNKKEE